MVGRGVAWLLATSLAGVAGGGGAPHLRFMSVYSGVSAQLKGWVNLGLEDAVGSPAGALKAWSELGIPSLYGDIDSPVFAEGNPRALAPSWRKSVTDMVTKKIKPNFGADKALRGVFLGDELCCHNSTCWDTVLDPLATEFRKQLGPDAILATNVR